MEVNEKNIALAIKRLQDAFGSRPGFPKSEGELEMDARDYLSLVHDKPVSEIIGKKHSKIDGDPNDCEWLENKARGATDFYPRPRALRQLYYSFLPPADGKAPEDEI